MTQSSFGCIRTVALFVLFAVACALLSSCTSKSELQKVEFLLDWKMESFYAPYVLASERGYFAEEGLDVDILAGRGAETSAKLIGEGQYKIGTCNAAATAIAVSNGVPVVSVAMVDHDAVTAIFSLKESGLLSPQDLIGKTLGVRYYDISHKEYLAMMMAQGIDTALVDEVSVGWELQPLLTGQVDALYNYAYNMPVILTATGHETNSVLVRDWGVKAYGANIIVNREFAITSPEIIRKFLRAAQKGWEDAIQDPSAAIEVLLQRNAEINGELARATLIAAFDWLRQDTVSEMSLFVQDPVRWDEALDTYESLGMINDQVDASDVYTNEFVH